MVSLKECEMISLKMEQYRFNWPLARILKLYPDKNSGKGKKDSRTIIKIVPLEYSPESALIDSIEVRRS